MFHNAYTICGTCPQEGTTHFPGILYISIYIHVYPRGRGISISIVLVSVWLTLLAQIHFLTKKAFFFQLKYKAQNENSNDIKLIENIQSLIFLKQF